MPLRSGCVVGLVSRRDLLAAIARPHPSAILVNDATLQKSISARLTEMLQSTTPPEVSVSGGVVRLTGKIRNEQERRAVRMIVECMTRPNGIKDHMQIAP